MTSASKQYPVKVSVVLPTFNQCMYLATAIQPILNQTYPDFELIIVNDGSTDETAALLATVTDPRVHIITQNNQGLPSALNTGFAQARGEYFTWTSTDNVVSPTWLEELVKALENSPPEVAYAFSYYAGMDENGKMLFVNRDQRFDVPTLLMRHTGNASFLYRSDLARKIGEYDTALSHAEDLDMWIRMAEATRAVQVESVLYYYRQHAKSMTAQQDKVRAATAGVVNKFLAKTAGKFDVDALFPSIRLSADPALEKWKARIWLVTLGMHATYYCPVNALIDQLTQALNESYESGLVANIVHLLVKTGAWEAAAYQVEQYRQHDHSDFLKQLADIIARRATHDLEKIPFLTLEEKLLASDCHGSLSQKQLLRNLAMPAQPLPSLEKLAIDLINQLEDQKDHPEVWQNISALQSPDDRKFLQRLRLYLSDLTQIPQDPRALILMQILEAVCFAYTDNVKLAKNKLQQLNRQHPNLPVLMGALLYLSNDEVCIA